MRVQYKVKGLNQFINQVRRHPQQVQTAVDSELNRSSLRVEKRAKEYAPWDTGWMSNNIYSHQLKLMQYEVISPVEYSIFVELGTRYMAAQPFIYPALEDEYYTLMRNLNKIVGGK